MLYAGHKKDWHGYHSTTTSWRKASLWHVIEQMKLQAALCSPSGFIVSLAGGMWPYRHLGRWILFLDCDSPDAMLAARHYLKTIGNLGSAVIESSPNRYWLVVNKSGSLKEMLNYMDRIPGVDQEYARFCRAGYFIPIRAFPKLRFIPKFGDRSELAGSALRFYLELECHFNSPSIKELQKVMQLCDGVKNGTIVTKMAADPGFTV